MRLKLTANRPLDKPLRERLHLKGNAALRLNIVRALMHGVDATGRAIYGQPFFALTESEAILAQSGGAKGAPLIRDVLARRGGTQFIAHGLSNIPESGPVVIAATHPTGMFDFFAHAAALLDRRPDLKVVANRDSEFLLGPDLIIPVSIDRQNQPASGTRTIRAMIQHLSNGGALLIFGSGRVSDRKNDLLVEQDWQSGATKASRSQKAPIIPAALDACNSPAYYRTRALARWLSGGNDTFGAMIGSLRHSAESLRKLGGQYDVHFGTPLAAGTDGAVIKAIAEGLVPGLYAEPG